MKTMAAVMVAMVMVTGIARAENEAHVLAQTSTGKLGREVAMLVCINPDQADVLVSGLIKHENGTLIAHGFTIDAEGRTDLNLAGIPTMPAVGNFSLALWMEAVDELPTASSCDVVYYSGTPLREVDRATLTVRKYVKR